MKNKTRFTGAFLAGFVSLLIGSSAALACPDCPFPMKIGDNQWLMPNSKVVLNIQETRFSASQLQTRVTLVDQVSGKPIASGSGIRHPEQRMLKLLLWDAADRRISGEIYWVNFSQAVIQAKFSCLDINCAIAREL